jgi:hypothetical protein
VGAGDLRDHPQRQPVRLEVDAPDRTLPERQLAQQVPRVEVMIFKICSRKKFGGKNCHFSSKLAFAKIGSKHLFLRATPIFDENCQKKSEIKTSILERSF